MKIFSFSAIDGPIWERIYPVFRVEYERRSPAIIPSQFGFQKVRHKNCFLHLT